MGMDAHKEAVMVAGELTRLYRQVSWQDEEADSLLTVSDLISRLMTPREALESANAARKLYKELGDQENEATALLARANLYIADNLEHYALQAATEARSLSAKAGDTRGEADALLMKARVHLLPCTRGSERDSDCRQSKVVEEAMEALLTSWKLYESLPVPDYEGLEATLQLKLTCQVVNHDARTALETAEDVMGLHDQLGNKQGRAVTLLDMAQAYTQLKENVKALEAAKEAEAIFEELGDNDSCRTARQLMLPFQGQ